LNETVLAATGDAVIGAPYGEVVVVR
jgi:hypothetical protein